MNDVYNGGANTEYNADTREKMQQAVDLIEKSNLPDVFCISTSLLFALSERLSKDIGIENEICKIALEKISGLDFSVRHLRNDLKDSGLL